MSSGDQQLGQQPQATATQPPPPALAVPSGQTPPVYSPQAINPGTVLYYPQAGQQQGQPTLVVVKKHCLPLKIIIGTADHSTNVY